MSTETWENMPKNQEDAEKPEEMADRVVEAHNNDPDAHLGENQSIQSHRAAEIIDHRARSVVGDKVNLLEDVLTGEERAVVDVVYPDGLSCLDVNWETNEWAGRIVYTESDEGAGCFAIILSNTSSRLYFIWLGSPPAIEGDYIIITRAVFSGHISRATAAPPLWNNRGVKLGDATDYVERTVSCNQLALICPRHPQFGKIDIFVDDELEATIDLYAPNSEGLCRVWEKTYDTVDDRTIKVVKRSDKNPDSLGWNVYINAFDINGVVYASALNLEILRVKKIIHTDDLGKGSGWLPPPVGRYFLAVAGWYCSDWSNPAVAIPYIFVYPGLGGWSVLLSRGEPQHDTTIIIYFLCGISDPLIDE